jgi:hypothetical protein
MPEIQVEPNEAEIELNLVDLPSEVFSKNSIDTANFEATESKEVYDAENITVRYILEMVHEH